MANHTFLYLVFMILIETTWCQITDLKCSPTDAPPRCFALTEDRLDFQSAEEACQGIQMSGSTGSYLAEPRTSTDTDTLVSLYPSLLPTDFVWFGLSDRDEEAVYRWTSDLEEMVEDEYNNWYQGELEFRQEPDGGTSENCIIAQVSKGWAWNDYDCSRQNRALCQINF